MINNLRKKINEMKIQLKEVNIQRNNCFKRTILKEQEIRLRKKN